MLYTAVEYKKGPIAMRYPRGNALGLSLRPGFEKIPIGKGETLRTGKDIALLAVGPLVNNAMEAAELLTKEGIEAEVVNMRFVKPLDLDIVSSIAARIPNILTIEDNVIQGGFGSAVLEGLQSIGSTDTAVKLHGLPDDFVEHGTPQELYHMLKLDAPGIAEVAKAFLASRQQSGSFALAEP